MNLTTRECLVVHQCRLEQSLIVVFYLEIVASVSTQNILLSSNDLENLLGDAKDKSFLSFDRTVSRILGVLSVNC